MSLTSEQLPWNTPPLNGWDIVGMNHYHVAGVKMLFVAMTNKNNYCIHSEGTDDIEVFRDLYVKAVRYEQNNPKKSK